MPKNRLPAIASSAVWEKVMKARAGIRWDNVVDDSRRSMEGNTRNPRRHTVHGEFWGVHKTEVKERIKRKGKTGVKEEGKRRTFRDVTGDEEKKLE